MALNKLESTQPSESLNVDEFVSPVRDVDHLQAHKQQFQSLLDTVGVQAKPNSQILDERFMVADVKSGKEEVPVIGQEDTSTQKNGSATDQEKKRHSQSEEEIEELDEVKSKKKSSEKEETSLSSPSSKTAKLNVEDLQGQIRDTVDQVDQLKTALEHTKGEIKPAYQRLLHNRLTHIDDHLQIALSKAGVERPPELKEVKPTAHPVERFLTFLTNSQSQLNHLNDAVGYLSVNSNRVSPANILAIQIKVGYIQQQIELFTSLLNKALESMKTIMNVQV
jgi:hypothetical protein